MFWEKQLSGPSRRIRADSEGCQLKVYTCLKTLCAREEDCMMSNTVKNVRPAEDSTRHFNPGKMFKGMPAPQKKHHKGKIQMKFEDNKPARAGILQRRRKTLFCKANELHVMTKAEVMVVVIAPSGITWKFSTDGFPASQQSPPQPPTPEVHPSTAPHEHMEDYPPSNPQKDQPNHEDDHPSTSQTDQDQPNHNDDHPSTSQTDQDHPNDDDDHQITSKKDKNHLISKDDPPITPQPGTSRQNVKGPATRNSAKSTREIAQSVTNKCQVCGVDFGQDGDTGTWMGCDFVTGHGKGKKGGRTSVKCEYWTHAHCIGLRFKCNAHVLATKFMCSAHRHSI